MFRIASDLRFAIRITNRNRSQIARFGALSRTRNVLGHLLTMGQSLWKCILLLNTQIANRNCSDFKSQRFQIGFEIAEHQRNLQAKIASTSVEERIEIATGIPVIRIDAISIANGLDLKLLEIWAFEVLLFA